MGATPEQLSAAFVALIMTAPAALTYLGTRGRKDRELVRRQRVDLDEAEDYIIASRRSARRHNDAHHQDGSNAIELAEQPGFMTREDPE